MADNSMIILWIKLSHVKLHTVQRALMKANESLHNEADILMHEPIQPT
jgi:hypothetical protein